MTPERWQQVKAIFNSAIKYRPEERNLFLSDACAGDNHLRSEVESLITSHEKTGSFIDAPAYEAVATLIVDEKAELKPGQFVGAYEIVSFISRGGMGEVYLAQDKRLGRKVALKLLPSSVTRDVSRLHRFEQEARSASALNHPNIITIYEISETASTLMIATEFVEGETLRERLARGALGLQDSLAVAIQIADALESAHKAGIVHRDIKPENIMIRPDGYVKVLDFGLAKLIESTAQVPGPDAPTRKVMTGSGVIVGTVGYMSPEQARGQTVDARSDIFNLGTVIYEMVAGRKPFDGETTSDVLAAILKTDPPSLSHFLPDAPAELIRIINKTLRKDREERYQVVKDLLLDLKSLKEELDFQTRLDRSVAPARTGESSEANGQQHFAATVKSPSETSEIKTAVSTITHSLGVGIRRHKVGSILALTAVTIVTTVGVIAFYKFLSSKRTEISDTPQVLRTTQITFSPGLDGFPSLSPDAKSVVYSSDQNGSFEIYIKQLTPGGGELQLTKDGQQNFQPSWSPDGQKIAYASKNRGGIWIISALGGTPKQLTDVGMRPVWSPDGSMIAYQSGEMGEVFVSRTLPPSTIWIIPSQGGAARQVTKPGNPAGGHASPSWSPDGKRIAFETSDFIFSSVWSIGSEGGEPTKIVLRGNAPIYAPDGQHVYFLNTHGNSGLSRIQVSPSGEPVGDPVSILPIGSGTSLANVSISADGQKIVYNAIRISSNLWTVPLDSVSGDAKPPALFTSDTSQRNNLVRFSPDGRKVALNRWRPGTSADIWIADADGKNLTQLTNNPATDSQASWFPEGDKLAFISDRNNNHMMVWTISLTTRKEEPLLDLGEGVQYAALSPDGNEVAYNLNQNGAVNVWVASVKTGQRKQLTFDDQLMGFPCWSPDGRFLAFEQQRGDNSYIMIIPGSGGESTQLTFDKSKDFPGSWSPDGDKIVFAGRRNGIWNLYWISRTTKVQKQLTNYSKLNAFVRYPAWSPLGNQIVYEYAETTGNLWMLELQNSH